MIARQLCGLVAQCRACLEADCSFALVRQRDPALNDTKRKKGTGYLSRAVRSARPHMLCRTKDGNNGRPLPSPLDLRRGQGRLRNTGRASRRTPGKRVPVPAKPHTIRTRRNKPVPLPNSPVPEADQRHPIPKGVGLELVTVAQAVAATTCRKSVAPRRQGSRVPSPRTQVASRVPPFAGRFLGRRPFVSLGRFLGRRPFVRSTIARWQEATDPQSPRGGSQRACTHEGCPPRGFWAPQNGGVVSAVIPCPYERWRC